MPVISIDGLHATVTGPLDPGGILVVAAHGLCLGSASWARTLKIVRDSSKLDSCNEPTISTLAYDHRDHGRSGPPEGNSSTVDLSSITDD